MSDKSVLNGEVECCGADCEKPESVVVRPRYTSTYDDEAWKVAVRLPGVAKDQVEVSIEKEILQIEALRRQSMPESWRALGNYPEERRYRLQLDVGPEVDPEKVTAVQEDGVLSLRLPLREEAKAKIIRVM